MGVEPSDRAVVEAVVAGDRGAYSVLVGRYQHRVFGLLVRMTGNRQDAEDLTQEVFYRAYFALASYDPAYKFSTWLLRIACNLGLNFHRRREREPEMEDQMNPGATVPDALPDPAPVPAAVLERRDLQQRLWRAVATLPDVFRQIILLRHFEELSYHEICEVTGLPLGTVKSRLARARKHLADALGDWEG